MNQSQQITLQRKSIWDVIKDFFKAIGRFFFGAFSSELAPNPQTDVRTEVGVTDPDVNYSISISNMILVDDPQLEMEITFSSNGFTSLPSVANISDFQIDVYISTNENVEDGAWTYPSNPNLTITGDSFLNGSSGDEVGNPMTVNSLNLTGQTLSMNGEAVNEGDLYGIKMELSGTSSSSEPTYYHGPGFSRNTIEGEFYAQNS